MAGKRIARYGAWSSPVTSDLVASSTIGLGQIALDAGNIYWLEQRPTEAGRNVLVRRGPDGDVVDVTPPPYNVRTRVHEYGGGAYAVRGGELLFANFADQRLYRRDPAGPIRPLAPEDGLRYADAVVDAVRQRLVCVAEEHKTDDREAVNTLVSLDLSGRRTRQVLAAGHDFYASPRLSPDGKRLAWLSWDHPDMPWDGTELWTGELRPDGTLVDANQVAGSRQESIFQPEWSPDGSLYFVSDRSGWWNLYRWRGGKVEHLVARDAEFGLPQWVFGMSTYGFESADRIVCAYCTQGVWRLATVDTRTLALEDIDSPYSDISGLRAAAGCAVFLGGSPTEPVSVIHYDFATRRFEILRRSSDAVIDRGYVSVPEAIEFPTAHGLTAYGFFYSPRNRDYTAPDEEKPPLLVKSHGGPTAATSTLFSPKIQYWTSRGIAVLDVNYGGSTGYGREYRRRLHGQWGVVDVEDCVNAARYLVERGDVDSKRLAISGGSAGGYTTLCALAFRDTFSAGASHYGVSELEALVRDTHKFESRYLDLLVGPYPERKYLYRERSPIHYTEQLSSPIIFFQGLEDKVVPPSQAQMMVEALRGKGLPVAYLTFEGEQHGFRQAETIRRVLEAELFFYGRIFGFAPAGPIAPITIENLES